MQIKFIEKSVSKPITSDYSEYPKERYMYTLYGKSTEKQPCYESYLFDVYYNTKSAYISEYILYFIYEHLVLEAVNTPAWKKFDFDFNFKFNN